jgi:hypothetical protein
MKKYFKFLLVFVLVAGLFTVTGCDKTGGDKKKKEDNTTPISYELGKGTFTVNVPKKEDGTPKYEFTTEKPAEISTSATFYLVTDTSVFGFSTSGLSYNTSTKYKDKYGDTKASFEGYLEFIEDKDLFDKSYLPGLEQFEINGRKALRYYNRVGGSGSYKYYGYFYMIGVDDIYPGSRAGMTVNYKTDEKPAEVKEFDEETLSIIKSLKIKANA